MPKYQIQYKNNSKTFTDIFEANSPTQIIDFFQSLVNAEITEIREIIYTSDIYPKDDLLHTKSVSCKLSKGSYMTSFKIPKLKNTLKEKKLIDLIKTYIKINNMAPENINLKYNF